jgi:glutamine amidotransferase PdxT
MDIKIARNAFGRQVNSLKPTCKRLFLNRQNRRTTRIYPRAYHHSGIWTG